MAYLTQSMSIFFRINIESLERKGERGVSYENVGEFIKYGRFSSFLALSREHGYPVLVEDFASVHTDATE